MTVLWLLWTFIVGVLLLFAIEMLCANIVDREREITKRFELKHNAPMSVAETLVGRKP